MKRTILASALLGSAMLIGGYAQAQNTGAAATSSVPPRAGEASTTQRGVPNAAEKTGENNRGDVKADARAANKSDMTARGETGSPGKGVGAGQKGEMAGSGMKSREDMRAERELKRADQKAERNARVAARSAKEGPKGEVGTPGLSDRETTGGNKQKP